MPADWLYYQLLDADFASNTLSWQWVSGAFNQKIYYANQENINKYCQTTQNGTFLDVAYADFPEMPIPTVLDAVEQLDLRTPLPITAAPVLDPELPTLVYNFYNLDTRWRSAMPANRILLLEPSVFAQHPVSQKSIDFCLALANDNIPGIQVWVAEFDELRQLTQQPIYFKEHPLNNYSGQEDARDWLSSVQGDFSSFFSFWKRCQRELL
jgi:deoxyribodipyrimidine photo-lyase